MVKINPWKMLSPHIIFVAAICLFVQANAIRFYLEPNGQKCLKEELRAHVLVTGQYEVTEAPGQKIDYIVSF